MHRPRLFQTRKFIDSNCIRTKLGVHLSLLHQKTRSSSARANEGFRKSARSQREFVKQQRISNRQATSKSKLALISIFLRFLIQLPTVDQSDKLKCNSGGEAGNVLYKGTSTTAQDLNAGSLLCSPPWTASLKILRTLPHSWACNTQGEYSYCADGVMTPPQSQQRTFL
jgi:hypothetical protein